MQGNERIPLNVVLSDRLPYKAGGRTLGRGRCAGGGAKTAGRGIVFKGDSG
jgi:hypothetical protein